MPEAEEKLVDIDTSGPGAEVELPAEDKTFENEVEVSNETTKNSIESNDSTEKSSEQSDVCLLYTSPSPRDGLLSRMPSSA